MNGLTPSDKNPSRSNASRSFCGTCCATSSKPMRACRRMKSQAVQQHLQKAKRNRRKHGQRQMSSPPSSGRCIRIGMSGGSSSRNSWRRNVSHNLLPASGQRKWDLAKTVQLGLSTGRTMYRQDACLRECVCRFHDGHSTSWWVHVCQIQAHVVCSVIMRVASSMECPARVVAHGAPCSSCSIP